jgi:hypothetical protein
MDTSNRMVNLNRGFVLRRNIVVRLLAEKTRLIKVLALQRESFLAKISVASEI